ncbi:hypothetical protein XA68_14579 [Ophiocordyceps unilateralis]|uniref:RNA polymerase II subunit B1 CTD phosphatase RPAP2 homolog n=1 Tax=Ophiocordyceps unilateralis TaxID=268505 RepID=A0A2A9PA88_OPHUN|nr:hypothetical protein XA68_14579 [Ophiocordyceps unilateralis]
MHTTNTSVNAYTIRIVTDAPTEAPLPASDLLPTPTFGPTRPSVVCRLLLFSRFVLRRSLNRTPQPRRTSPSAAAAAMSGPSDASDVALQHARLLQQRKDLEAEILDSLVLLAEYPLVRSADCSAASPAPSDVSGFKTHVRLFQPSDYTDLVEERNVNGLCGYALCPRPRRQAGPGGEWKITAAGDIVKRKDLEMWCSDQCARRALYVQVQLNETAAWERAGIPEIQIDLYDELNTPNRTTTELGDTRLENQRHAARDAAALALERGERADTTKVKIGVAEKDTRAPNPIRSSNARLPDDHLLVEGHKTQLPFRPRQPN